MAKKQHEHYVNNRSFTKIISEWVIEYKQNILENKEPLRIPAEAVYGFEKIARRYASRPNFSGYVFKQDMISEAVYTCIKYAKNFNPDKSDNAFSYFTQICHNEFLKYINKEKKYAEFKFSLVKDASPILGKNDYKDITLIDNPDENDEDNLGFAELEKQEKEVRKTQFTPIEDILNEIENELESEKHENI